jgi:hypothetical protein
MGRVVRRYLGALEASRSSKGKRRNVEAVQSRLLKIDELLVTADPLARLHLTQERIDLHAEMVRLATGELDLSSLEKDFVRAAKSYGEMTGVTYAAWRQVGVETEVLDQAGIIRVVAPRPDAARSRRPPDVIGPETGDPTELVLDLPVEPVAAPATEPTPEPAPATEPTPEPATAPEPKPVVAAAEAPEAALADAGPAAPADDEAGPPKKIRRKRIADKPAGGPTGEAP